MKSAALASDGEQPRVRSQIWCNAGRRNADVAQSRGNIGPFPAVTTVIEAFHRSVAGTADGQ